MIIKPDFNTANGIATNLCGKFICVTIEIADNYMVDALRLLEKESIYKQEIKRLARQCRWEDKDGRNKRGILAVTSKIRNRCPSQEIYTAYVDNCMEHVKKDIQMLYLTVLQHMTRKNVPNRELLSRMEVARILLIMASNAFTECFDQIRTQCNISSQYKEFCNYYSDYFVGHIANDFDMLFTLVNRKLKSPPCNLNDSPDIKRAYDIILRHYTKADFLDDGAEDTLEEYHELFEEELKKAEKE